MTPYLGELAALTTAFCWTFTSIFFTLAGRQAGSVVVNRVRLVLAVIFLMLTHWLWLGTALPLNAEPYRWFWLGLSGVVGLVLGDAFLFQAYVLIGPRMSMLMMSLVPVISTALAWIFLAETLSLSQVAGVGLTVSGIAWVVMERAGARKNQNSNQTPDDPNYLRGILFGIGAATGQALGLILAKQGLGGDFPALSGNLIRMLTATAVMWSFTIIRGQAGYTLRRITNQNRTMLMVTGGAISGPFLGVWLSLVAIQLTQVGIASTLMALTPVILLPVGYFFFKEQLSWRAVIGTIVAIVGVATLLLV
jgi:drug/metabolite transporter (DMT)-like permease